MRPPTLRSRLICAGEWIANDNRNGVVCLAVGLTKKDAGYVTLRTP
jgi:hypothetical protein